MPGLGEGDLHMPGAAFLGAAEEGCHDAIGQEIAGRVIQCLIGEVLRGRFTGRFCFSGVDAAYCLNKRIISPALGPRPFCSIG